MQVQNTAEIRSYNKKRIIKHLRLNDRITKKILADELGLSSGTISNLCNQLVNEDILQFTSSLNSNGGRIPDFLYINPASRYSLCLNIIGTKNVEIALVNLKNEVVSVKRIPINEPKDFKELVRFYYSSSDVLLDELGIEYRNILGLGVAISGKFNKSSGCIVSSINPAYENKPLKSELEKVFGLPAYIENETYLMVLVTSLFENKTSDRNDIIYLYFGEGLGSGIISCGTLCAGAHGLGGEMNHMPIGNRDYECYCGKKGCIETELTEKGFIRKYNEFVNMTGRYTAECWNDFVNMVICNDEPALKIIEENGRLIGKLISVLVNIFDPESIYLGGITEKIFDHLYPFIIDEAKSRLAVKGIFDLNIFNSTNYDNLIFKGCEELVFSEWKP